MNKNMNKISGKIVANENIFPGTLHFTDKIIDILESNDIQSSHLIIPGFIDLHCHGGNGFDTMDGLDAIIGLSEFHLKYGTTTLYPTTVTAPLTETKNALKGLNSYINSNKHKTNIAGIHLEGPFINPDKLGAQPPFSQIPNSQFIEALCDEAPLRIMTIAPEVNNGFEFIDYLIKQNIKPQLGHTLAEFSLCNSSIKKGVKSFTHLYNAMSGFDHRKPGAVAAALSNLDYSEVICDLIHVDSEMIKIAKNNIKNLYAITDCISAAGMKDGKYKIGSNEVFKKGNVVKLNNDTLGGSVLTMHQAFKNLIEIGFSIIDAVKMTSTNAADYIERKDIGNLSSGCNANIVVLDDKFDLLQVFLNGESVYEK